MNLEVIIMLKKSMVKLASLGWLLLAFAAPGQAQAKAKTTTPKTTNAVLWLNYNTYVYNKKGQRIRWFKGTKGWQKYYKKGTKIKTKRTVKRTTKDVRYYLLYSYDTSDDTKLKKYWLPYKKIKGNYFYSIGHGYYIKARNVYSVNSAIQYSNGEKVTVNNGKWSYILTIASHKAKKKNKTIIKSTVTKKTHNNMPLISTNSSSNLHTMIASLEHD